MDSKFAPHVALGFNQADWFRAIKQRPSRNGTTRMGPAGVGLNGRRLGSTWALLLVERTLICIRFGSRPIARWLLNHLSSLGTSQPVTPLAALKKLDLHRAVWAHPASRTSDNSFARILVAPTRRSHSERTANASAENEKLPRMRHSFQWRHY